MIDSIFDRNLYFLLFYREKKEKWNFQGELKLQIIILLNLNLLLVTYQSVLRIVVIPREKNSRDFIFENAFFSTTPFFKFRLPLEKFLDILFFVCKQFSQI